MVQRLQYATKCVSPCYCCKWEPHIASVSRDQHWHAMWNPVMSVFHTYLHSCNTEASCTRTKSYAPQGLAVGCCSCDSTVSGSRACALPAVLSPQPPRPTESTRRNRTGAAALHHQLKPLSRLRALSFHEVPWVHFEHEHYIADSDSKQNLSTELLARRVREPQRLEAEQGAKCHQSRCPAILTSVTFRVLYSFNNCVF